MEHFEAWNLLDEYHDGELSPMETREVRDHLKACPECAGALEGRELLSNTVTGAVNIPPSGEFVLRISRALGESTREPALARRWPLPTMAVAVAATAFIMVGLMSPAPNEAGQAGLISTTFEYENGGPMPVLEEGVEIANHDQVLGSLLEES